MRPTLLLSALGVVACLAAVPAPASVSIYMTPEQLARRSSLALQGVVEHSASGYDEQTRRLSTYVTLRVTAVHRGPRDLERVILREPGGRVGTLVHEVDAVPDYAPGERVFVFLEPAGDGALRTTGMFYGKYRLEEEDGEAAGLASRDLQGQGRIFGGPGPRIETLPLDDLIAVTATVRRRSGRATGPGCPPHAGPAWTPVPRELSRLAWDSEGQPPVGASGSAAPGLPMDPALIEEPRSPTLRFTPQSSSHPARWQHADSGAPVIVHVQPDHDPLGDADAAVAEIVRAMAAWTDVPEARVWLQLGDGDYDYTAEHGSSPAAAFSGKNIVLFGDPYDDISDPVGCSGMLAIGGYWRFITVESSVNGVFFFPMLQLYVIFNDRFECFLGDPDNLAEVATHELGHGLGFGHSDAFDSIMRSSVYGGRGPRLGDDDRDAAHCHYPHRFEITRPAGGELWEIGAPESIEWTVTEEQGPDPGSVDLEYSTDGGTTWKPIAAGTPNDGHHVWVVPNDAALDARVRVVRYNRGEDVPSYYPSACSRVFSPTLAIVQPPPAPGSLRIGGGDGLKLAREGEDGLKLSWAPSCSAKAEDYAIYSGSLAALRQGEWNHQPVECSAGPDLSESVVPLPGDRYFLVAPLADSVEGLYGSTSSGTLRPPSGSACAPREESASTCQ